MPVGFGECHRTDTTQKMPYIARGRKAAVAPHLQCIAVYDAGRTLGLNQDAKHNTLEQIHIAAKGISGKGFRNLGFSEYCENGRVTTGAFMDITR